MTTQTYVRMNVESHAGYSADQVAGQAITLGALRDAVEQAIEDHDEDTVIVIHNGQRYGASWGRISQYADVFEPYEGDDDE